MAAGSKRSSRVGGDARVGELTHGFLHRLDKGGNLDRAKAVAIWREVAGEDVAAHAMGYAMREKELVVSVDSPVWATELAALSERYRTEINSIAGRELVGSMRFTVSKRVAEERVWEDESARLADEIRPRHIHPMPASDQERAQIAAMAAAIHSDRLRESAVRAATRALEWRKGMRARKTPQNATGRPEGPESEVEH